MNLLSTSLAAVRHQQGLLLGTMRSFALNTRTEAGLIMLTSDVVQSNAIEGNTLDVDEVRSSLARRLGIDIGGLKPASRHVEGVVEIALDAALHYKKTLSAKRLFSWHAALFPTGYSNARKIAVAVWRGTQTGPMQVVSGAMGHEKVHFEAPPAERVSQEMKAFLDWFNAHIDIDPILKAGIAHFWFITIHPFEDGNGRIARTIADLALARADASAERFYSMSGQLEKERKEYYQILEKCQKGTTNITAWLDWFLACLGRAFAAAEDILASVLYKATVWQQANQHQLNERQRLVLNKLFDNFNGKLTSGKYAKLAKCSSDTALRDIRELLNYDILKQGAAGGRSTNYELAV